MLFGTEKSWNLVLLFILCMRISSVSQNVNKFTLFFEDKKYGFS